MPKTLGHFYTSGLYALYSRAMSDVSASTSSKPAPSDGPCSPVVADVESSAEDVIRAPMDDNIAGKEVAVCPIDPQTYRCENVWVTIFRVSEVQNPLLVVWQKNKDDLLESLRATDYQHGAELMTVANFSSGKLGSANDDSFLEHRGEERIVKNKNLLAVVACGHRRSCNQTLATSGQPGTEWASRVIRMTLI